MSLDARSSSHVALITGANHGIGAATGRALAAHGVAVFLTYLRLDDPADPGTPDSYHHERGSNANEVVQAIRSAGGRATALDVDLPEDQAPTAVFDAAEEQFGAVDILVNNASGWTADTFKPTATDRLGRSLTPVSLTTFDRVFGVDARAAGLLISEFARRHIDRKATWGRIIGLTSGGPLGFPQEVSYGAAKAALENFTMPRPSSLPITGSPPTSSIHPSPTRDGSPTMSTPTSTGAST